MKDLIKLQKEVAKHLGIDPLPIRFEEMGDEDSRLYIKEEYVGINIKYKDDFTECAKSITHEYRHVFQMFYANLYDNEKAQKWKKLLTTHINTATMNENGSNYINQELEIDSFAFTKYYLGQFEHIDIKNKVDGLDKYLDIYINENISIM